jgi:DNA-binding LacI/PurR family transcriptional regulator
MGLRHADVELDPGRVALLIADQFPQLASSEVRRLMRQLDGHAHEALSMELATRLVVRDSTGRAPLT